MSITHSRLSEFDYITIIGDITVIYKVYFSLYNNVYLIKVVGNASNIKVCFCELFVKIKQNCNIEKWNGNDFFLIPHLFE